MQIETLWPRDQAQRLLKVSAEFFCIARFARVVAGRPDAACQASRRVFETGDVVTLPAVHGDGQTVQLAQGLLDIHADGGVALLSNFPRLVQVEWSCAKLLGLLWLKLRHETGNFTIRIGGKSGERRVAAHYLTKLIDIGQLVEGH